MAMGYFSQTFSAAPSVRFLYVQRNRRCKRWCGQNKKDIVDRWGQGWGVRRARAEFITTPGPGRGTNYSTAVVPLALSLRHGHDMVPFVLL